MRRIQILAIGILFLLSETLNATNYFLSLEGNDSNNGISEKTAWLTIDKMNQVKLNPGDKIFFRCNDIFKGQLIISYSGKPNQPIVIGSYGSGNKPILCGAIEIKNWNSYMNGIYKAAFSTPTNSVYVNDQLQQIARYPNTGFNTIQSGDKLGLMDPTLKFNFDLTGAGARIRSVNWQYEVMKVASSKEGSITFTDKMVYQCSKGYGYFLDNKLEFVDVSSEWYYDENNKTIYFKPADTIDIAKSKVEATVYKYGIVLNNNVNNIIIQNLKIEKYDGASVYGAKGTSNVSIIDCNISNNNVYGIALDLNTSNYSIRNNHIEDIRGRGISTIESSNNVISDNIIKNIGLHSAYGFDGVNNGIGIAVIKTEVTFSITNQTMVGLKKEGVPTDVLVKLATIQDLPYADEKFLAEVTESILGKNVSEKYMPLITKLIIQEKATQKYESTNNKIINNYVENTGYAGIRLDGNNSIAEKNVIKNTLLYMNDGGALYCWAQNFNYTYDNIFRSNIIINGVGNCEATPNDLAYAFGIYTDNYCHHITIEKNTVVGMSGGILINDVAHHQTIIGNTTYDNQYGLIFSEYCMPGSIAGCVANDNILFCKKRTQRALFVESRIRDNGFVPGTLDRNLYANPFYPFPITELTFKDGVRSFKEYTLLSWQKKNGQDATSITIATPNHDAGGQKSMILINEKNSAQQFKIPTDMEYVDVKGTLLHGNVTLSPYQSMIIMQK